MTPDPTTLTPAAREEIRARLAAARARAEADAAAASRKASNAPAKRFDRMMLEVARHNGIAQGLTEAMFILEGETQ